MDTTAHPRTATVQRPADGREARVATARRPLLAASPAPGPPGRLPRPAALVVALATALLAGAATSVAQGGGPFLATLANSAGPWFVVAGLLVLVVRPRLRWAMPLGVLCLGAMHVGYTVATRLGGAPDTLAPTNPWVVLAVPAGLLAGAVATALVARDPRVRSLALGTTGAVLVGEGVRALLQVAASTSAACWSVEIGVGALTIALAVVVGRTPVGRVVGLAAGVVGAAAVLAVYLVLGAA